MLIIPMLSLVDEPMHFKKFKSCQKITNLKKNGHKAEQQQNTTAFWIFVLSVLAFSMDMVIVYISCSICNIHQVC